MSNHLIIAPIVLPLLVAALQLLVGERRRRMVLVLSVGAAMTEQVSPPACCEELSDPGISPHPPRSSVRSDSR